MNQRVRVEQVRSYLPLLACPSCRAGLALEGQALRCGGCAASYPLVQGRPVFLPDASAVKVMPVGHLSNQPPAEVVDWLLDLDGVALNLGAGGTSLKLPHCLEMEYSIFRHTDVVGDAHHLPFGDETFDAVVTLNTFEHLYDPTRAAAEIHRVLKPGGRVFLHTAFLQPLHEPPHHYYNVTEFGLRRWFAGFDITDLSVSDNFNPAYVLAWLSSEVVRGVHAALGQEAAERLEQSPLGFWRACWENPATRADPAWGVLRRLPQDAQKRFAAGFQLQAVKTRAA
jgi:SAM-dependent methyltransferase